MKKLTVFFKQLRLSQLLTAFLATVVVFVGTACNSGTVQGARPDNPPVQAGGANNPYKGGGDSNTNYNFSPDPKINGKASQSKGDRADLGIISNRLIAVSNNAQYPGEAVMQGSPADEQKPLRQIDLQDFEAPEPGGQIQRESNIGERIKDRLSVVKETFGEASDFVREGANESAQQEVSAPKTTKANF
ncbi:hypothetical protein H6F96_22455 [Microcoleus sp. FACHB-53]|nr:hypothetical protein [Microcoleus sp. FACHB-53]